MADNTIAGMIKRADGKAKVYNNNANHPGHTTAAFNKQKVPYQAPDPSPQGDNTVPSKLPQFGDPLDFSGLLDK